MISTIGRYRKISTAITQISRPIRRPRDAIYRASIYRASIYRASIYRASIYRASIYRASIYRALKAPSARAKSR
jgi:hypothetical protein